MSIIFLSSWLCFCLFVVLFLFAIYIFLLISLSRSSFWFLFHVFLSYVFSFFLRLFLFLFLSFRVFLLFPVLFYRVCFLFLLFIIQSGYFRLLFSVLFLCFCVQFLLFPVTWVLFFLRVCFFVTFFHYSFWLSSSLLLTSLPFFVCSISFFLSFFLRVCCSLHLFIASDSFNTLSFYCFFFVVFYRQYSNGLYALLYFRLDFSNCFSPILHLLLDCPLYNFLLYVSFT